MSNEVAGDPAITGETLLWRRVPFPKDRPDWYKPPDSGEWRPSSAAFKDHRSDTHELSAYVAAETSLERLRNDYPYDNVAEFPASIPLQHDHTIRRVPDEGYDSHVEITPPPGSSKKTRLAAAREMAEKSKWVHFQEG
ncbi:MAG TPA: hypothetical protein VFV34_13115 [Blastocatellia bacterium]|nr:hypothetical protein [Blastocatellia bacterium]